MRRTTVSAVIGSLLLIACGPGPAASSTPTAAASRINCVDVAAANHAYVVVQHMSGTWIERCIGFAPDFIDGQTIMDRSGIQYQTQPAGATSLMCQVDLEPRHPTGCVNPGQPHWALFVELGGHWSLSHTGFSDVRLFNKQALGWRFVRAGDAAPSPPPLPNQVGS